MSSSNNEKVLVFVNFFFMFFFLLEENQVWGQAQPRKPSDTDALMMFRLRTDAHGNLATNWTSDDACVGRWAGVGCDRGGRVTSLSLPGLDLRGPLDSLAHLDQLRHLHLTDNRLNGSIDVLLNSLTNLKFLYVSHNDLTGPISAVSLSRLRQLLRLDLSSNSLSGPIPPPTTFALLKHLLTLRLQDNLLSGLLPNLCVVLPNLTDFNVSNNQLSGRVPESIPAKFGVASLAGNAGLCGSTSPLPPCTSTRPSNPLMQTSTVVPSMPNNSSSAVQPHAGSSHSAEDTHTRERRQKGRIGTAALAGIAIGNVSFLLALAACLLIRCNNVGQLSQEAKEGGEERGKTTTRYSNVGGNDQESDEGSVAAATKKNKLVFFDQDKSSSSSSTEGYRSSRRKSKRTSLRGTLWKKFGLEELLRASAEMIGKGSLGTVYRAVLEDGLTVAVKRLRDSNPCSRRDMACYMDKIGRLRHPNIVPLRAYYYADQEKLLIYDYLPNGSLHALLHTNRGARSSSSTLDWTRRVGVLLGVARGVEYIHREYRRTSIPHGNIKSTNVLLDNNGLARVADFGLALLLHPAHATARLGGYRAPEQAHTRALSQEADIYAFGVLLLEVLTGRAPSSPACCPTSSKDGGASSISPGLPEWVKSVVREEWTAEVFDAELMRYKQGEEEMMAMLQVALACVAEKPERRPTMREVVKMIEDVIRVEKSPPLQHNEQNQDRYRTPISPSDQGDFRLTI